MRCYRFCKDIPGMLFVLRQPVYLLAYSSFAGGMLPSAANKNSGVREGIFRLLLRTPFCKPSCLTRYQFFTIE